MRYVAVCRGPESARFLRSGLLHDLDLAQSRQIAVELSFAGRNLVRLQEERGNVSIFGQREAAGAFGWHQLLNPFDEVADGLAGPGGRKFVAAECRRVADPAEVVTVTRRTIGRVGILSAGGLRLGVNLVPDRSWGRLLCLYARR